MLFAVHSLKSLVNLKRICSFEHHKIQRRIEWAEYLIHMKVHIVWVFNPSFSMFGPKIISLKCQECCKQAENHMQFYAFCEHSKFEMIRDVNTFEKSVDWGKLLLSAIFKRWNANNKFTFQAHKNTNLF